MEKWQLIIIIIFSIIPLTFADIECQWSPDNLTRWRNITHINENLSEGLQTGLQSNTKQFFRCQNESLVFGYQSVNTNKVSTLFEGENMATLILWFALAAAFLFLVLAIWKEDTTMANLSAILLFITGFWIIRAGFGDLDNLLSRGIGAALWGIGMYIFFKVNLENM